MKKFLKDLLGTAATVAVMFAGSMLVAECAKAEPVVGLHIASHHWPAKDYQNNDNPGLYVRLDSGFTAGFYRNTLRRTSFYAGWTWEYGPFAITAGGITGYKRQCDAQGMCWGSSRTAVMPMLAPSVRLPEVLGVHPRIWYTPRIGSTSSVIHLSIERSF